MQDQLKKAEAEAAYFSDRAWRLWLGVMDYRSQIVTLAGAVHRASKRARAAETENLRLRQALTDINDMCRAAIEATPARMQTAAHAISILAVDYLEGRK